MQKLQADGFDVQGVTPQSDKRARLSMIADKIQRGIILFPKDHSKELVSQLVHFGVEKHDDLVDALTIAVLEFIRDSRKGGTVKFIKATDVFGYNPFDRTKPSRASRSYWNRRLDDWDEAMSGAWD